MTNAGSPNHNKVFPVCGVAAYVRRWEWRVRDAAERERERGKEGRDEV